MAQSLKPGEIRGTETHLWKEGALLGVQAGMLRQWGGEGRQTPAGWCLAPGQGLSSCSSIEMWMGMAGVQCSSNPFVLSSPARPSPGDSDPGRARSAPFTGTEESARMWLPLKGVCVCVCSHTSPGNHQMQI